MIKVVTEKLICKIFCFMSILVWGMLFLYSMFETWINDWDLVSEYVKPVQDSLIGNTVGIMAVLAVVMMLYTWGSCWIDRINMDILAGIVCIFALGFSIYWVGATNTFPQADSLIVYDLAKAFENLDYSSLQQGGYVSIYRHQLGLITFWRLLFKIFGMGNYLVFQYLNAMMVPVLIFSGYRITKRISENNKIVGLLYLLLTITCVPLYCYVPFLYGEMISTALVVFATWMLMDTFEKFSPVKIVLMSIALGAAIQFRRNTVIFLIAFLIVAVIQLCRGWDWKVVITIVGIIAGAVLLQFYINNIYHELIPENSLEAPASVYIAMGVNTDNGMAGWHNFYDQNVFVNNDCNIEKTNQEAWTYFGDFFRENKDNPGYLADFYYRKICSQWNSPMYQCLAMNNIFAGEQSDLQQMYTLVNCEKYWKQR